MEDLATQMRVFSIQNKCQKPRVCVLLPRETITVRPRCLLLESAPFLKENKLVIAKGIFISLSGNHFLVPLSTS